jgi:hypothetical protein
MSINLYQIIQRHSHKILLFLVTSNLFDPRSGQVGFVVDKVALGQVFSEYFGFPFQQLLHNHPHLSSGAGTIGQKWPQYKVLSPTPLAIKKYLKPHKFNLGVMYIRSYN